MSAETLAAILDALGEPEGRDRRTAAGRPGRRPGGGARAAPRPRPPRAAGPGGSPSSSTRSGRSDSWGHGDLHDLAELARWSASELGAGFVLINPLHAAEPLPPVSPSPYLPMTRRYASPLYLRVEDIPEYGGCPPGSGRIDAAGRPAARRQRHRRPDRQGRGLDRASARPWR